VLTYVKGLTVVAAIGSLDKAIENVGVLSGGVGNNDLVSMLASFVLARLELNACGKAGLLLKLPSAIIVSLSEIGSAVYLVLTVTVGANKLGISGLGAGRRVINSGINGIVTCMLVERAVCAGVEVGTVLRIVI
jgi:hypothetical protein